MFYQIFFSPQVKRWATITCKHGIYLLPHELPNDLRLRIFAFLPQGRPMPTQEKKKTQDLKKLGKCLKLIE